MRKTAIILFLACLSFTLRAQNSDGYNPFTDEELSILLQDSTATRVDRHKPVDMIGVRYSYQINNVSSSPDIGAHPVGTYNNYSLVYTHYTSLWNMMPIFGVQAAAKYGEWAVNSDYLEPEHFKIAELSLLTQVHFDFSRFRFLAQIGPYTGYRLATLKENDSFDKYDNRFDYGLMGGIGFGVMFGRFEFQIEGNYQFSLSSIYHMNKYSDEYWLNTTPRNIVLSATLFYHLF